MKSTICDLCEHHQCRDRNAPDTAELQDKHECDLYHHFIGHQYHHAVEIMPEYLGEGR